jgi:hypothetical protein
MAGGDITFRGTADYRHPKVVPTTTDSHPFTSGSEILFTGAMDTTSFDLLLEEFESALHQGERPEISLYLERAAESQRSQLLRELIRVDLCCRRDESPAPGEMEYQALFPDEHAIVAEAFRLFRQQPTARANAQGNQETVRSNNSADWKAH